MIRKMPAETFLGWYAYSQVEKFGEEREDARAAFVVRGLYNINRDSKKHPAPFELGSFQADLLREMDELPTPKRSQTWQEQKAMAFMIAEAHNKNLLGIKG